MLLTTKTNTLTFFQYCAWVIKDGKFEEIAQLKASGHNHSMSIFRPFFYFLVLRWPICRYFSFELSHDTSKRLNSRLGTKSRSKKKKILNFIPSKSLHFFAKSQPFGFAPSSLRHS